GLPDPSPREAGAGPAPGAIQSILPNLKSRHQRRTPIVRIRARANELAGTFLTPPEGRSGVTYSGELPGAGAAAFRGWAAPIPMERPGIAGPSHLNWRGCGGL